MCVCVSDKIQHHHGHTWFSLSLTVSLAQQEGGGRGGAGGAAGAETAEATAGWWAETAAAG